MPGGLLSQLRVLKAKLSVNQILSILALATVIFSSVLVFVYMLHKEPYQTLLTDLDAQEANSVVQKLDELDIPYELADGSRTILVPAGRIDQVVMDLASVGLPNRGRIGFEIFDETQWGVTEFAEKVKYRRALEGELERTIVSLSEISSARVHLVMEKESLFVRDTQPAKASVAVRLDRGVKLGANRVTAISNLVAFAVEGLSPEQVTVVDAHGNLLSQPNSGDEVSSADQLQHQRKVESDLEAKVISLLQPLVGRGGVRATASVRLNLNDVQQTEEIYDPNGAVILSQTSTREFAPQDVPKSGIPFKANLPPGEAPPGTTPLPEPDPQSPGRSRSSNTTNYHVSKTLRNLTSPRGSIQQISMAVVVDDKMGAPTAEGEAAAPGEPRSAEEMESLAKLVRATVGFSAERGDVVTVENVSFTGLKVAVEPMGEEVWWEQYYPLIQPAARYVAILVFFVLFYFLIFRPVKKRVFSYVELSEPEFAQLAGAGGNLARQIEGQLGSGEAASGGLVSARDAHSEQVATTKSELLSMAKDNPDRVSNLVQSWLSEGATSGNE